MFLVFIVTSVVVLFVATRRQAQFGSDFAVVGLVHAFVLFGADRHVRRGQRRALQPRRDLRRGGDASGSTRSTRLIYMLAQLSGGVLGALLTKALPRSTRAAPPTTAPPRSAPARRRLPGRAVEAIGTFSSCSSSSPSRSTRRRAQGMGAAGDRHHAGLHRHGRRPADRRLLQPGPLVRPGAGRQRLRRRLALHRRPARRLAARRRGLQVRARAGSGDRRRPSRPERVRAAARRPPRPGGAAEAA